jgi:phage shock protein PspC (stress-responsive transcriptional regulator)
MELTLNIELQYIKIIWVHLSLVYSCNIVLYGIDSICIFLDSNNQLFLFLQRNIRLKVSNNA